MKTINLPLKKCIRYSSFTVLIFLFALSFSWCKKEDAKSNKKEILFFSLTEQTEDAVIDSINKKITIIVKYDADLSNLSPVITVSDKASISPASGAKVDFSKGSVTYTVTAEDKSTQNWTVTVSKAEEKDKNILSFDLSAKNGNATINNSNATVEIKVNPEADLKHLSPQINVSDGATISPASGAEVDFSQGPVTYVVTASDGSTTEWTVTVTRLPYTGKDMLAVSIPGQVGTTEKYSNYFRVIMPYATDFKTLSPVITISPGAIISPASGEQVDFSEGFVEYTVTSENSLTKTWRIYVTVSLIAADNSNIKYVGRIDFKNPVVPRFSAPGVYLMTKFTGTFCDIDMYDETNLNYIVVIIDDQAPVRILMTVGKSTFRVANGLSDGEHTILICKETEAGVGALNFYGFRCEGLSGVTDLPTRKIECYGNSITVGAKMLFGTPCDLTNDGTNWNAANSAYLSYGALTARNLNAQWHITAVSGIGLIHSCCSMNYTLPDVYDRVQLNETNSSTWDFSKYIPDVVTICLGQNDGSTVVASKEFKDKYIVFINTIRVKYPDASIFCLTSPMADSSNSSTCLFKVMKTSLAGIVDSLNTAGDSKVYWVKLPHDQNNGCPGQGHPSEAEHQKTATILEAAIRAKMGW